VRQRIVVLLMATLMMWPLLFSCAKAPQEKIAAAQDAIEKARAEEADRYAGEQFMSAKDSLDAAVAIIEQQNSKFSLFRRYGKAERLLQTATTMANAAKDAAVNGKEQMGQETQRLIVETQAAIASARDLLKKAPRGKDEQMALKAIKTDLETVESVFSEALADREKGDVLTARDKIKASLEKVRSLSDELKAAIEKKGGPAKN
jgi:hypothetical protein